MRGAQFVGIPAPLIHDREGPAFQFMPAAKTISSYVNVTASASANTKGSWVELVAATTAPATWLVLSFYQVTNPSAVDSSTLMDIGFGAGGAEVVRLANVPVGYLGTSTANARTIAVPLYVPVGTRIAARVQSATGSRVTGVSAEVFASRDLMAPTTIDTIGANTTSSVGVTLATSSAWTEIVAATTQPYRMLIFLASPGGTSGVGSDTGVAIAGGVGASGSETQLTTWTVQTSSSEVMNVQSSWFSNLGIATGHFPAGTRVAMKQSTTRTYWNGIVLGVPYS